MPNDLLYNLIKKENNIHAKNNISFFSPKHKHLFGLNNAMVGGRELSAEIANSISKFDSYSETFNEL